MKNFETLYKILMNEAEYEDISDLEQAEDEFGLDGEPDAGSMTASDLTPEGQIKDLKQKMPELTDETAKMIVAQGKYSEFLQNQFPELSNIDDEGLYDMDDSPSYEDLDAQGIPSGAESLDDYDME